MNVTTYLLTPPAQFRKTVLESIKEAGTTIGGGVREYLSDWEKVSKTIAGLSLLALGVYSSRAAAGVAGRYIEAQLGKPSLVRETSKVSAREALSAPVSSLRRSALWRGLTSGGDADALSGVVLSEQLEGRLRTIARSTFNTRKNGAPYRHVMLHLPTYLPTYLPNYLPTYLPGLYLTSPTGT